MGDRHERYAHNDQQRHWRGDHGLDTRFPAEAEGAPRLRQILATLADKDQGYIDVHAWQFTPESLRCLLSLLRALDLCGFRVERVYGTARDSNEFYAILTR